MLVFYAGFGHDVPPGQVAKDAFFRFSVIDRDRGLGQGEAVI